MISLPLISAIECSGCGLCCDTIGTPPGFFPAFCSPDWDGVFPADSEDYQIWLAMPDLLRRELGDYYRARRQGSIDRVQDRLPCLWLDTVTRTCRNYEHRPTVCREFEVGGEDCRAFRADAGI